MDEIKLNNFGVRILTEEFESKYNLLSSYIIIKKGKILIGDITIPAENITVQYDDIMIIRPFLT